MESKSQDHLKSQILVTESPIKVTQYVKKILYKSAKYLALYCIIAVWSDISKIYKYTNIHFLRRCLCFFNIFFIQAWLFCVILFGETLHKGRPCQIVFTLSLLGKGKICIAQQCVVYFERYQNMFVLQKVWTPLVKPMLINCFEHSKRVVT